MRDLRIFVCVAVLSIVLLPCYASAQGTDPPPCCFGNGAGPRSFGGSQTTPDPTNQIVISDDSLRVMGMSRSDFVDRLAGSLFFGRNVDLIVSMTRSVDSSRSPILRGTGDFSEEGAAAAGALLAVQENRLYRVSRARLRAADIDALDRFYITDGQIFIEVMFKRVEIAAAIR